MAMLTGQVVYSVLQMHQGDSCGLLVDPSSAPSVGLPSDQCHILSLRESDGMRLTTAVSGPNNDPLHGGTPQSKQWNAFIARYHYLGYKTLVGAQMRYTVHDRHGQLLALLGFSTAARKLAPRDRFIGWTPTLREKNLPKVIDNARFLILPWIRIPNLASHILSVVCRQLIADWTARYHIAPLLIETFVETPRFTGVTYKASGWTHVGITQGRGRYDRHKKYDKPKKTIWLRPLRKDWKRTLNR